MRTVLSMSNALSGQADGPIPPEYALAYIACKMGSRVFLQFRGNLCDSMDDSACNHQASHRSDESKPRTTCRMQSKEGEEICR